MPDPAPAADDAEPGPVLSTGEVDADAGIDGAREPAPAADAMAMGTGMRAGADAATPTPMPPM